MDITNRIGTEIDNINFDKLDEIKILKKIKNKPINKKESIYLLINSYMYNYFEIILFIKKEYKNYYLEFNKTYKDIIPFFYNQKEN